MVNLHTKLAVAGFINSKNIEGGSYNTNASNSYISIALNHEQLISKALRYGTC